ncbi:homeobox protein ceh-2-like [Uranotaenia lowii]|uniref:homeobox protein ceh-2-like n=1 Tax=Uranotaenia lowii TaxID=190385 RepID=UPI002479B116|nr:homeobox protein ceh-2-like [Uranotaenia lowii]
MSSEFKNVVLPPTTKQSDFSIEHILTKAGEKYERKRARFFPLQPDSYSCSSTNTSSHSDSQSDQDELMVSEEDDEEIVVDCLSQSRHHYLSSDQMPRDQFRQQLQTDGLVGVAGSGATERYLQNCVPSFDWLYYTRYRPPKLPRPQKAGPVKRTPGRLPRVPFTPAQLSALEDAYKVSTYLSSEEANQLAYGLELTNTRVKIWFQNRRARDRREKREASALSIPGSSESGVRPPNSPTSRALIAGAHYFGSVRSSSSPPQPPSVKDGGNSSSPEYKPPYLMQSK